MRIPKYRKHSSRNKAFIEVQGKREYLPGTYNSRKSKEAYRARLQELLEPPAGQGSRHATVRHLVRRFVESQMVGMPSEQRYHFTAALRKLDDAAMASGTADFGPLSLQRIRRRMVDDGWSRAHINAQVNRLRRVFRWGVAQELVAPEVLTALNAIDNLKRGETTAKESAKIKPPNLRDVASTIRYSAPTLAAMIRTQWLTGMRSHHLVAMRWSEVDTSGDIWIYRPLRHDKNVHRDMLVPIGPRTQAVLRRFHACASWIFSPRRSCRELGRRPQRSYGHRYETDTYRQAVVYAIRRARCGHWHPHQLRHAAATRARKVAGIEAAQVYLGHERADVTQVYAERDLALAVDLARRIG